MVKSVYPNTSANYESYIAKLENELTALKTIVEQDKGKIHRRNMQIADLKKRVEELMSLLEQIVHMSLIHGVYKDDTECLNAIREAIHRNATKRFVDACK